MMHFEVQGAGRPAFLFVHGFSCDLTDWQLQVEALKGTHRVAACDLRGHGNTPANPDEVGIGSFGADVAQLVGTLDLAPVILVGHSMGCRAVLEAARLAPSQVRGVVLIDGSGEPAGDPDEAERAISGKLAAVGFAAFAESRFQEMFSGSMAHADRIIARARRLPEAIGTALYPRLRRWDAEHLEAAFAGLRVPLLVIQSTVQDSQGRRAMKAGETSDYLEFIRRTVPQARIEVIPDVGHFTQLDAPDQVNRLLADFAKTLA